jgi:hypothetical protein
MRITFLRRLDIAHFVTDANHVGMGESQPPAQAVELTRSAE